MRSQTFNSNTELNIAVILETSNVYTKAPPLPQIWDKIQGEYCGVFQIQSVPLADLMYP